MGKRTVIPGLADLAVRPFRRNLLTVERRLDRESDDSDDERGDRGFHEEPDDRGDNQERDQYAGRDRGHLEPAHRPFPSAKEPELSYFHTRRGRRRGSLQAGRTPPGCTGPGALALRAEPGHQWCRFFCSGRPVMTLSYQPALTSSAVDPEA